MTAPPKGSDAAGAAASMWQGFTTRRSVTRAAIHVALTAAAAATMHPSAASGAAVVSPHQPLIWKPVVGDVRPDVEGLSVCAAFVTYLARFLLNYDPTCRNWWEGIELSIPATTQPVKRRYRLAEKFGEFAASLSLGFQGLSIEQVHERCLELEERYGKTESAKFQLALLFTLLKEDQPIQQIQRMAVESRARVVPYQSATLMLPAIASAWRKAVGTDPTRLMGKIPLVYDELRDMFVLPSVFTEAASADSVDALTPLDQSQAALGQKLVEKTAFGPIGSDPVSKQMDPSASTVSLLALSGAIGCCLTHASVIPLDVVKTRMQTQPGKYMNIRDGVTKILREEGPQALFLGTGATLVGYIWYGVTVYPLYDVFKHYIFKYLGPVESSVFHTPAVLLAGALATIVACFGVCPCEKVRIRTVAEGLSSPSFFASLAKISREESFWSLWQGLPSLMTRQVLFGMTKFLVFESVSEELFQLLPWLGEDLTGKLFVSLASGAFAGVLSAIVSQPADTVLSQQAKARNKIMTIASSSSGSRFPSISVEPAMNSTFAPYDKSLAPVNGNETPNIGVLDVAKDILAQYGPAGFYLGLGSRCLWSGLIISGQFLLFDFFRSVFSVTPEQLREYWDVMNTLNVGVLSS